jgi:EipB-like
MNGMRFLAFAPLVLAISGGADAVAQTAAPLLGNVIAPHRAIYDIGLARTEEGSGVTSAAGRMVFEITGSSCAGYTMRQRMVVNIADGDGNPGLLDFRIATFESGDGGIYSFDSETKLNEQVVEAVAGEARRHGGQIEINLKQPAEKTVSLDGSALFPSQHMQAIIDAAQADHNFLSVDIYEGAGTGEASDEATAAIGASARGGRQGPLTGDVRHWPVSVGYFGEPAVEADKLGEELPSYQMSFTLYENGITSDLVMDYGDYALSGALQDVEPLADQDCPRP